MIALARIDDRLIHGQVVVKWLRAVPCDEILICDDQIRSDAFFQRVLSLAAPPQVRLAVKSLSETASYLTGEGRGGGAIMLLMREPRTALELVKAGVTLPQLYVGGMGASPGSKRLYKSISATPAQIADLRAIRQLGVRIIFQMVPAPEESGLDFDLLEGLSGAGRGGP